MSLYFIAITAPEAIDREVLGFKNFMLDRFGCRVALKSPAHITLIPPFQLADVQRKKLTDILDPFAEGYSPFEISLRNFAAFKPRVIYVDVRPSLPLVQVQGALETTLLAAAFQIKKSGRAFHPHVTIANRDLRHEDFATAWEHFETLEYSAAFEAAGISLLELVEGRWKQVHLALFA